MHMARTDPISARVRSEPRATLGPDALPLQTDLRRTRKAIIGHTPKVDHCAVPGKNYRQCNKSVASIT